MQTETTQGERRRLQASTAECSDVDLAVDVRYKLEWGVIFRIKDDIEESTISFFVDVIYARNTTSHIYKDEYADYLAKIIQSDYELMMKIAEKTNER